MASISSSGLIVSGDEGGVVGASASGGGGGGGAGPSPQTTVFPEDLVALVGDPSGDTGIVCCINEDNLKNGSPSVHVFWFRSENYDKMEKIGDLMVVDRPIYHGDTVIYNGKRGIVLRSHLRVDLRFPNQEILRNIDSRDLKPLNKFKPGTWVLSVNGWLGRVLTCIDNIVVEFGDGSRCKIVCANVSQVAPVDPIYEKTPFFPWAACATSSPPPPSDIALPKHLTPLTYFPANWRLGEGGRYKRKPEDSDLESVACVIRSETTLDVLWQDGSEDHAIPATRVTIYSPPPQDFFPGDFVRFSEKEKSEEEEKEEGRGNENSDRNNASSSNPAANLDDVDEYIQFHEGRGGGGGGEGDAAASSSTSLNASLGEIAGVVLRADPTNRIVILNPFPRQNADSDSMPAESERITMSAYDVSIDLELTHHMGDPVIGLELEDNYNNNDTNDDDNVDERRDHRREIDAMYEGAHRIHYDAPHGGGGGGFNDNFEENDDYNDGYDDDDFDDEESVASDDSAEIRRRIIRKHPRVGEVVQIKPNGFVLVAWMDGTLSTVHPHKLFRVVPEEEDGAFNNNNNNNEGVEDMMGGDGSNIAHFLHHGADGLESLQEGGFFATVGLRDFIALWKMNYAHIPHTPGAVANLAARYALTVSVIGLGITMGVFYRTAKKIVNTPFQFVSDLLIRAKLVNVVVPQAEEEEELDARSFAAKRESSNGDENGEKKEEEKKEEVEVEEEEEGGGAAVVDGDDENSQEQSQQPEESPKINESNQQQVAKQYVDLLSSLSSKFSAFDVLESAPKDHLFLSSKQEEGGANQKKLMSAVRKEWTLLQSHLPPGVMVRVFEDRMDLIRAVIFGPIDTPYQFGIFVFDILLPADYPNTPPSVLYHAHRNRLNPNLYECGKVCLSLLGTWAGTGPESWNAKNSTILQVLVSIQGLILVPEPYYNEPNFDTQKATAEGQEQSRLYNESVTLLSLQNMGRTMSHPPVGFEEIVKFYFMKQQETILGHYRAILSSPTRADSVGGAAAAAQEMTSSSLHLPTLGFQKSLERTVAKLETEFAKLQ